MASPARSTAASRCRYPEALSIETTIRRHPRPSRASCSSIMPYTPNNDTIYSGAVVERADEPIILSAADITDRYLSVEVVDCYTNNLFYIGTPRPQGRAGTKPSSDLPGMGRCRPTLSNTKCRPTALRIGVVPGDSADLAEVNTLQDKFSLTALSNWADPGQRGKAGVPNLGQRPHYEGELAFYQTLADLPTENPPPGGPRGRDHAAAPRRDRRR